MNIEQTPDVVDVARQSSPIVSGHDGLNIYSAAMDAVASPLYVVYSDGRLLFANSAAKSCLLQGRWLQSCAGRVDASSHLDSAPSLGSALEKLRKGNGSTVLLTHQVSGRQAVVTVAPLSVANSAFSDNERLGLIWLTTSDPDVSSVRTIARLFKLTGAEHQLLSELTSGASLRAAATRLNVSIHTVRNQLKSVLSKTGRHSQTQLLTWVTRMASLRLPDAD